MRTFKTLLLVSALGSSMAQAEIWAEREALSKVESEFAAIKSLILTAKSRSNPEDRTTFDYTALLSDVDAIRAGIRTHLTVPMEPVFPSTINALEANYTEHKE